MAKRKWKKWGIVLMCLSLLFTSVVSMGTHAFAANMETDIMSVGENLYEEDSRDVIENDETMNEDDEGDTEDKNSEIEDVEQKDEENKTEDEDIFEDADENQEKDGEEEGDVENLGKKQEDTEETDVEVADQKDEEDEILTEGVDEKPMLMAASGASGTFGDTNWMISTNGKLTVEGTGEAGNTNLVAGTIYRTLPWYEYRDSIISAEIRVTGIKDISYFFYGCSNLTSVDLRYLDTSNAIKMGAMFWGCKNLTSIEWGSFDTSNVKYMDHMFAGCNSLTSLDVSSFDTSNVTDMDSMFSDCQSIIALDLEGFDTSNVTRMGYMFHNCGSLTALDLSSFNTSKVTTMESMFSWCQKLTALDLTSFDTSNVTSMGAMFSDCDNLTILDLSSFDMGKVKYVGGSSFSMLEDCYNLTTIYTPRNLTQCVELPGASIASWYLPDGTVVTELPQNLDHSIVVMKNKIPTEDKPGEEPIDDKLKYVRNITQVSLQSADAESKQIIENALYNLLFKAEYCPMKSEISGDTMSFAGTRDIIARWPIQNKDYETQAYWNRTVNDAKLGSIKFNNAGAGCMAYAYFATTYIYGTNGSAKKCSNTSANGIKEFIHQYADPGEHLRYEKPHSLVFLGESSDGKGFYCISYEGGVSKRGTYHLLRLMYKSYENFANEVAGKLSIFDANNGSYYIGTAKTVTDVRNGNGAEKIITRLACPVEATIELNGEILDSRSLGTASYGTVERDGDEIVFTLDYSPDYNLAIVGTGEGVMTLTLEYYDGSNALIDQRVFVRFPIKDSTEIQSSGFDSQSTFVLYASDESSEMATWGAGIGETVYFSDNMYRGDNDPDEEFDNPSSSGSEENNTSRTEETDGEWNISNRVDLSEGIGTGTDIETWKPTTPDEKKRYACVGSEAVQYTLDKDNPYRLIIEKAMQGPLCFDSFEAVMDDYTIGRTYNIYPYPDKVYNMDKEVQFTIKIPKAIYKPDREYKMICVTKNGLPIVYEDLDKNPETITVRTNKFYAYALIYKDMK